jgi:hypothetical protein
MPNELDLIGDVATGGLLPFEHVQIPRTQSASLVALSNELQRDVRSLHDDSSAARRSVLLADLEDRQQAVAATEPSKLLRELGDAGMSWRDVARLVQVSVPAVQKWRRGGDITGANRLRLARVVALLEVLSANVIAEQVSWLEMPVKDGVHVSRMDMLADGRFDLVLELISDDHTTVPVEGVLDDYEPSWRTSRVDNHFETYVDAEGIVAIRPTR